MTYKKILLLASLFLGLSSCAVITGATVHKNRIHALLDTEFDTCIIQFNQPEDNSQAEYKTIEADIPCNKLKFFEESHNN